MQLNHRNAARSVTRLIECLEPRKLLSADLPDDPSLHGQVTADTEDASIQIVGTTDADAISIRLDADTGEFVADLNGTETRYAAAGVENFAIFVGDGNDAITLDASVTANSVIHAGAGDDTVIGGVGNDKLFGGDGNDVLAGQNGRDLLRGEEGDDALNGGAGNDLLWGHAGLDTLAGGEGGDLLRGGDGDDVIDGQEGNDTLIGHNGNDYLNGARGRDQAEGRGGLDRVFGGEGDDAIDGGDDDDEIDGGLGANLLLGGNGADIFVGDMRRDVFADANADEDWRADRLEERPGRTTPPTNARRDAALANAFNSGAAQGLANAFANGPAAIFGHLADLLEGLNTTDTEDSDSTPGNSPGNDVLDDLETPAEDVVSAA